MTTRLGDANKNDDMASEVAVTPNMPNMDRAFHLTFGELRSATSRNTSGTVGVQHFHLDLLPTQTALPQLELVGRYQELQLTFYASDASTQAKPTLIIDTKGLDPLLRCSLRALQVEIRSADEVQQIASDVSENRKGLILIDCLSQRLLSLMSFAARHLQQIFVLVRCDFLLPTQRVTPAVESAGGQIRKGGQLTDGHLELILVFPWEGRRGVYIYTTFAEVSVSPYFALLKQCAAVDGVFGWTHTTSFKKRRQEMEMLVFPHRRLTWASTVLKEDLGLELCSVQFRDLPTRHNKPDASVNSPTAFLVVNHHSSLAFTAILEHLTTRRKDMAKLVGRGSAMPVPLQSIYRLARQLQLHELAESALQYYKDKIDLKTGISGLFSESAAAYPELAAAIMDHLDLART
jgi:hypothetical protein